MKQCKEQGLVFDLLLSGIPEWEKRWVGSGVFRQREGLSQISRIEGVTALQRIQFAVDKLGGLENGKKRKTLSQKAQRKGKAAIGLKRLAAHPME